MKLRSKKGFTLMEMLIVVAIIAILIAIAIPAFSASLTKSKQSADNANVRSTYSELMSDYLTDSASIYKYTESKMQAKYNGDAIADITVDSGDEWKKGDYVCIVINDNDPDGSGVKVYAFAASQNSGTPTNQKYTDAKGTTTSSTNS